jgi:hypothetical protein
MPYESANSITTLTCANSDVAILADSADAGFPRKRQLLLTPSRHTGENRTEGGQTATVDSRSSG